MQRIRLYVYGLPNLQIHDQTLSSMNGIIFFNRVTFKIHFFYFLPPLESICLCRGRRWPGSERLLVDL